MNVRFTSDTFHELFVRRAEDLIHFQYATIERNTSPLLDSRSIFFLDSMALVTVQKAVCISKLASECRLQGYVIHDKGGKFVN